MKLNWRESIGTLVNTGDIIPLYSNLRKLVEIESRTHFSPSDFNLSSWSDSDIDELSHEIFLEQVENQIITRLASRMAAYLDAQWNRYFTLMIRHHLLQKIRRNKSVTAQSGGIDFQNSPGPSRRFEIEEIVRRVLIRLTSQQRRILKGQCEGKTLDEISQEIKTIKKSAVHKAKQEAFDLIRKAGRGEQDLGLFVSVLYDLLGASPPGDKEFPTVNL